MRLAARVDRQGKWGGDAWGIRDGVTGRKNMQVLEARLQPEAVCAKAYSEIELRVYDLQEGSVAVHYGGCIYKLRVSRVASKDVTDNSRKTSLSMSVFMNSVLCQSFCVRV